MQPIAGYLLPILQYKQALNHWDTAIFLLFLNLIDEYWNWRIIVEKGVGRYGRIWTVDPWHPMTVRYQAAPHTDRLAYNSGFEINCNLNFKAKANLSLTAKVLTNISWKNKLKLTNSTIRLGLSPSSDLTAGLPNFSHRDYHRVTK